MEQQSTQKPSSKDAGVSKAPPGAGRADGTKEQSCASMSEQYISGKKEDFFGLVGKFEPETMETLATALETVIDSVYHDGLADAQLPEDKRCVRSRSDFTTCNCFAVVDILRMAIAHVNKDVEQAGRFIDHVIMPDQAEEWLKAHPEHEGKHLPESVRKAMLKRFVIVESTVRITPEAKVWTADE